MKRRSAALAFAVTCGCSRANSAAPDATSPNAVDASPSEHAAPPNAPGASPNATDDMIFVPEGPFTMGADHGGQEDERPAHEVTLDAYWLDRTEVTNEAYEACVR